MAEYSQPSEIAFKRRKLDGGQREDIFFNEEGHQQSIADRITSFISKTVSIPIRSLWRIMRNSSDGNVPTTSSERSVVPKVYRNANAKDSGVVALPEKEEEEEVVILSYSRSPTSLSYSQSRSPRVLNPLNHLKGSSSLSSAAEDEEIKILEAKITEEEMQDKRVLENSRLLSHDSDDDVQLVSVVEHQASSSSYSKNDIQEFKNSIFQSSKENTNDSESGLGTSSAFLTEKYSSNVDRLRNSFGESSRTSSISDAENTSESITSGKPSLAKLNWRSLHLSETIPEVPESSLSFPTSSSGLRSTDKFGRRKDENSVRLDRVKRQNLWKDVGRRRSNISKTYSRLQKVIDMDARERYRRFLNSLAPNCNVVNFPASPKRDRNLSPTEILLRGRNILDQIYSENVTVTSSSPSVDSLTDDLKCSVSSGIDLFEARLETEKNNSLLTKDRLLRHMRESELRQKRAEVLTLEKKLREFARRDEEISLEEEIRKKLTVSGYVFRDRKPKPEKAEFPELDDSALGVIKTVWHNGGPMDEKFGEGITRKDLLTLRGLDWLNDEVINTYLGLICERARKDSTLPKVYAFNTFFYTNLEQFGYSKVKRWTRKVDIFSYDILLVPVHLGAHWCLAVIDMEMKCMEYYDSMGGINNRCLDALKSYLAEESMDKKKKPFSLESWKFCCRQDIPHQKNGSDCGMFACKFADFRSRRAQIIFSQENMPYYRQRMVYEICRRALM